MYFCFADSTSAGGVSSSSVGPILGGMSNNKFYHSQFTQLYYLVAGIKLCAGSNIIKILCVIIKSLSHNIIMHRSDHQIKRIK